MRQLQALGVMMKGKSVFLTGPPGSGKTYVLNEFIRLATRSGKNVAVTASTGIAATHIGGTTVHSWSGLGIKDALSEYDKEHLKQNARLVKRYNAVDVLVIDEISMLHGLRLDMINVVCKLLRQSQAPFGGLQVILVGDLFQLPPINRSGEAVDFVHNSGAWQELAPTICYLTEQHRQTDDSLLHLLEAMRRGDLNELYEAALRERLERKPVPGLAVTRLYSHNIDVDSINQKHLQAITSEAKKFVMQTSGGAVKVEQLKKSVLAPEELELRIGAEVMFVANDFASGFVNGSRGRVIDFDDGLPIVELANGRELKVERHTWKLEEDGKKRAEVAQLPLRLAWAITIHKSQGMSLDAAEIDLGRSFTPGMGYVALSRVRSMDGV
jgi:ATP-dependent exoDNAse (exonuclease V) alpha subunit